MCARAARSVPGAAPAAARLARVPGLDAGQSPEADDGNYCQHPVNQSEFTSVCGGREPG